MDLVEKRTSVGGNSDTGKSRWQAMAAIWTQYVSPPIRIFANGNVQKPVCRSRPRSILRDEIGAAGELAHSGLIAIDTSSPFGSDTARQRRDRQAFFSIMLRRPDARA
jgi:hypothetical protein